MRTTCYLLLASTATGARVAITADAGDLKRDASFTYPGEGAETPLSEVTLPEVLTGRQRSRDRTSIHFVRDMLKMSGADYTETFCSRSTDDCATVDEYPGYNTHSELTHAKAVEELPKTPGREVRGEIRRMGDLGYLIFNDILWYYDWKTFPIGSDIADHRKHRPTADALMGSNSQAWNRNMIRQNAQAFFEGRDTLNQEDIKEWVTKLFHKMMLNMDITDQEALDFEAYKGASTTMSTLPRWLVSGLRWVFGVRSTRNMRDEWIAKYEAAMDADTRGIIPAGLEGRDKRFLADLLLTAMTSAGGISVPSVLGMTIGILHGAAGPTGEVLPEDQRRLTNGNIEQFVLETTRRFPVVVGFPWYDPEVVTRTLLNLAMSLRDPRAWDAPRGKSCNWLLGCDMVVDTGTSVLAGPPGAMGKLLAQIGNVSQDCSNVAKLPTLSFTLAGNDFTLEPEFYVLRLKDEKSGKDQCQIGIEAVNAGVPIWILGDPFLRKYYTVWDAEAQRVGFALAKSSSDSYATLVV